MAKTLAQLAICAEDDGELLVALDFYRQSSEQAEQEKNKKIEELARAVAARLLTRIPKLTVSLSAALERKPPEGLTIEVEGAPLPRDKWGKVQLKEPGYYTIVASAPGFLAFTTTIELAENKGADVEIPPLDPEAPPPEPGLTPMQNGGIALITIGGAAAIGGVAAIGVGANQHDDSIYQPGLAATIVGGVLLGTGLVLFFVDVPTDDSISLVIEPSHVRLGGRF